MTIIPSDTSTGETVDGMVLIMNLRAGPRSIWHAGYRQCPCMEKARDDTHDAKATGVGGALRPLVSGESQGTALRGQGR